MVKCCDSSKLDPTCVLRSSITLSVLPNWAYEWLVLMALNWPSVGPYTSLRLAVMCIDVSVDSEEEATVNLIINENSRLSDYPKHVTLCRSAEYVLLLRQLSDN